MSVSFAPLSKSVVRGMTWDDLTTLRDDDGLPVDLTGIADLVMRVRTRINTTAMLMELSITNGRLIVTDAPNGKFQILVIANDTRDLFPENGHRKAVYVYDGTIIRTHGPPEEREPAIGGKVRVKPQITRTWETPT